MDYTREFTELYRAFDETEACFIQDLRRIFKRGRTVKWRYGGSIRRGTVIDICGLRGLVRIEVLNEEGQPWWIYASHIIEVTD